MKIGGICDHKTIQQIESFENRIQIHKSSTIRICFVCNELNFFGVQINDHKTVRIHGFAKQIYVLQFPNTNRLTFIVSNWLNLFSLKKSPYKLNKHRLKSKSYM